MRKDVARSEASAMATARRSLDDWAAERRARELVPPAACEARGCREPAKHAGDGIMLCADHWPRVVS